MKLKALLIVLGTTILVATLTAFADVAFQDVLDTPATGSKHAASSPLVGIAQAGKRIVGVGQRGHIVYSDDGGKNWTQASVPVSSDLVAVCFPTPQQGWAVGHDGIVLHTADGGGTWMKQLDGRGASRILVDTYMAGASTPAAKPGVADTASLPDDIQKIVDQGPDKPFLDVWFENETTGFIVGAFSLIFRTTDGGKNWTPWYDRIDNPKRLHLNAIRAVDTELYLSSEQGTVFKLDQKAGRFRAMKTPYAGTFFGITGKPGVVIAFGMRGNAYRSRDGGKIWQKVETGVQCGVTAGAVTADERVVLVSQEGNVLISSDDGASFVAARIDRPVPVAGVAAIDSNTLALAGLRGTKIQTINKKEGEL